MINFYVAACLCNYHQNLLNTICSYKIYNSAQQYNTNNDDDDGYPYNLYRKKSYETNH